MPALQEDGLQRQSQDTETQTKKKRRTIRWNLNACKHLQLKNMQDEDDVAMPALQEKKPTAPAAPAADRVICPIIKNAYGCKYFCPMGYILTQLGRRRVLPT